MITREKMIDLAKKGERDELIKKIESYIDDEIEENILKNKFTFTISTGRRGNSYPETTMFWNLWDANSLSDENKRIVHEFVIAKYRLNGFDVCVTEEDVGYNMKWPCLLFKDIDKIWKQKGDNQCKKRSSEYIKRNEEVV